MSPLVMYYANLKLKSLLDVALCARMAIVMRRARIGHRNNNNGDNNNLQVLE